MRVLTGLQPSGDLHIGNYFGAIKQMVDAQEKSQMFMFIANYHAMTSSQDGEKLKQNSLKAAAAFLSLCIDPKQSLKAYLQKDYEKIITLKLLNDDLSFIEKKALRVQKELKFQTQLKKSKSLVGGGSMPDKSLDT
ncbi:hypothetical protein Y863_04235, partial [Campylobacter jejuni CVM 41905]